MICNICNKKVFNLRTNTHIFPRCLIVKTKENGRNVSVNQGSVKRRNIKDVIANKLWCDDCEKRFSREDNFAKSFFIDKIYFSDQILISRSPHVSLEVHDPIASKPLMNFIAGVVVRYQAFLESKGEELLGTYKKLFFNYYLNGGSQYQLRAFRYYDLNMLGYPKMEIDQGVDSVFCIIFGFRFYIEFNRNIFSVGDPKLNLCDDKNLNFVSFSFHKSKMKSGLLRMMNLPYR
jgi:hypothetical protein